MPYVWLRMPIVPEIVSMTLLTDVFLIDEMLRPDAEQPAHTPSAE